MFWALDRRADTNLGPTDSQRPWLRRQTSGSLPQRARSQVARHLSAISVAARRDGGEGHAPLGQYFARLRTAVVVCDGDAPLWQYFSRLQEPDEWIADPKGRESWHAAPFLLQNGRFYGCRNGGPDACDDPRQLNSFRLAPEALGRGPRPCPVVAVLAARVTRRVRT
jgi:hypothetical protein